MSQSRSEHAERIRMLRLNPEHFVRKVLNHDPWDLPVQIMNELAKPNARVAVKACHSSGKCVAADELILLSDGSRIPAAYLVGRTFNVLTATAEGQKSTKATAEWNAIEQVITLTTESGRRITRNLAHPLYVAQKFKSGRQPELLAWTPMQDIAINDYVAVPYTLHALKISESRSGVSDDEVMFIAYSLGSLGLERTGPFVTKAKDAVYHEYRELADRLGFLVYADPTPFVRGFGYSIGPKPQLYEFLRSYGLLDHGTRDCRVPNEIFISSHKKQALFISRLFSFGGYVDPTSRYRINFYTESQKLAEDVKHILLVLDIQSWLDFDGVNWRISIPSAYDCRTFFNTIGIFGQEEVCMAGLEWCENWFKVQGELDEKTRRKKPGFPNLYPGLMWEKVTHMELAGVRPTVAIEVPETNTFLTSFHEHNTHTSADATFWFTCTGGKTISTAPSWPQVEKLLWGEMHRTFDWVGKTLGGLLLNTEYKISSNAYAFGISTDKGVNMQGHHDSGGGVLVVIDEAPGVKPDIWEAIEGIRAGGDVRILALGNPVISGGEFFEAFNKNRRIWSTFTIGAFDTPNLRGITLPQLLEMSPAELNDNERPYLVTRRWVYEKYHQWGEKNPNWISRVMGEFPDQASFDLMSSNWLADSFEHPPIDHRDFEFQAGVDVAGAGSDSTVVTVRHGDEILEIKQWEEEDPRREVADMLRFWHNHGRLIVTVDSIGIGHYFIRYLIDEGFLVIPVNVSVPPMDDLIWIWGVDPSELPSRRFGNLKAQLYWGLREKYQSKRVKAPKNALMEEANKQLKTLRWREDERNGKIYIESKESMKKRGLDSPDLAESIMLAFAELGVNIPQIPLAQGSASGWGLTSGYN